MQVYPSVSHGSLVAPDHDYPAHIEISLTAIDSRGLEATRAVSIYPRTVDLYLAADVPGVELGAGLASAPGPFHLLVIEGANIVLSAPPSALLGDALLPWRVWSDGGARVHAIVVEGSATYTASYLEPAPAAGPPAAEGEALGQPRPPRTRIVKRPPRETRWNSAVFVLGADREDARFRCRLDRGPYRSCPARRVYRNLVPGAHTLRAFALDRDGVADPTPVVFAWTVLAKRA